ncbi:SulP family inorganic anion transporter [Actinopolymorpha alba]|uniref:SulP family inorganic anion transporter n=1 Tax=Actinopolymorpha alba TaxID=533267 RepID=UPI001ED9887E|nr:bifunctional SulP family inorganic anion transporter/carbonic anhydrase [Actinopolymorpha alba]
MRHDLPASLVVFLVAVPLSVGIAVAAGAPVIAGLVAAGVGGIVAGALGGSALQVSGPAAGLTVIVAEITLQYGWAVTCLITALAGLIQIALGLSRVARAALAVSPAIVHGMLAGVGIVIALGQLHVVLGGASQSSAVRNLLDLPGQIVEPHSADVAVGLLTIVILLLWPRLPATMRRVPAPLVAILGVTLVAILLGLDSERLRLPDDPLQALVLPRLPESGAWQGVLLAAVTVAMVASVESLLSAVAVDRLHSGPRVRLDRELIGQGAANVFSGALGGYPVTGVIVRSSANVGAGARTRMSAVLHGVWVVGFTLLLGGLLEYIPLAALAGLLVYVGVQLVNVHHIRNLVNHREIAVYAVTAGGVVVLNLVEGVLLGVGLAVLLALRRMTRAHIRTENQGNYWHVVLEGSLTFLAVPRFIAALAAIPRGAHVDLDLNVDFMDHAAFDALHSWRLDHERLGGKVDIDEIHERWYEAASAGSPPPTRPGPAPSPRWFAPWSTWQDIRGVLGADSSAPHRSGLAPLLIGARDFHRRAAPLLRPYLSRLAAEGQAPSHLFITCADSRLVPNLMTASGPGDLFTVRNVGNLVPQHDAGTDTSVAAALTYALEVLRVDTITVCGHSHCGGVKRLSELHDLTRARPIVPSQGGDPATELFSSPVDRWLRHGLPLTAGTAHDGDTTSSETSGAELSQRNVAHQLANLHTYPIVADRLARGELRLVGMYFDIEAARLLVLDEESGRFTPVERLEHLSPAAGPMAKTTSQRA